MINYTQVRGPTPERFYIICHEAGSKHCDIAIYSVSGMAVVYALDVEAVKACGTEPDAIIGLAKLITAEAVRPILTSAHYKNGNFGPGNGALFVTQQGATATDLVVYSQRTLEVIRQRPMFKVMEAMKAGWGDYEAMLKNVRLLDPQGD